MQCHDRVGAVAVAGATVMGVGCLPSSGLRARVRMRGMTFLSVQNQVGMGRHDGMTQVSVQVTHLSNVEATSEWSSIHRMAVCMRFLDTFVRAVTYSQRYGSMAVACHVVAGPQDHASLVYRASREDCGW